MTTRTLEVAPALTQWGSHVQVPVPLVTRPLGGRRFPCPATLCIRRFRSPAPASVHHEERHHRDFARLLERVRDLAQVGKRSDREIADTLGVTVGRVEALRRKAHIVRKVDWYGRERHAPMQARLVAADERLLLQVLARDRGPLLGRTLFDRFNAQRQAVLRPPLRWTRFYVLMRGLGQKGRVHARPVRDGCGLRTHWSLPDA